LTSVRLRPIAPHDITPLDDARWQQWIAEGRAAAARARTRRSSLALLVTAWLLIVAAFWTMG
jgi:hypothetical protein